MYQSNWFDVNDGTLLIESIHIEPEEKVKCNTQCREGATVRPADVSRWNIRDTVPESARAEAVTRRFTFFSGICTIVRTLSSTTSVVEGVCACVSW